MSSPRRPLAAALAVLSLTTAAAALRPEPAPAARLALAGKPVWAPDRVAALLAEAEGTIELERAVDTLLGGGDLRSCFVAYEGNRPVVLRRPDLALTPASTQKVLVAVAAVHVLGPDFRFETRLVAAQPPREGVVEGLWLVGSGDPFLATPEYLTHLAGRPRARERRSTPLAALADELARAGVRSVPGGIRGDDSRYDRTRTVPTWKPGYVADNHVGPLGALVVNGGFSRFAPPEARADDPAAHAAGELARLAHDRGVDVPLTGGSGTAPSPSVTVAEVRSEPLTEMVTAMLRESDNLAAELLVREIGRRRSGDGSTPAGTAAVVRELAALGLPVAGLRLGDGSGLEVTNTASCALLASALRPGMGQGLGQGPHAPEEPGASTRPEPGGSGGDPGGARGGAAQPPESLRPNGPVPGDVRSWLAVAGRSGTLVERLVGTPLEGKLAAKTGSLRGVTGLTGFVDGRRRLSFALLANGAFSEAGGRLLQDRLVAVLANYPGPQPRL
jgi:D-alanyl-D-alanine carboxypeptidase/D-alanyl-D-alanine-endopeptidase (penicillin-binding protein 4)